MEAEADANDIALIQKSLAHRDAQIARRNRALWIRGNGCILPEVDQRAPEGGPARAVLSKRVRFAV